MHTPMNSHKVNADGPLNCFHFNKVTKSNNHINESSVFECFNLCVIAHQSSCNIFFILLKIVIDADLIYEVEIKVTNKQIYADDRLILGLDVYLCTYRIPLLFTKL